MERVSTEIAEEVGMLLEHDGFQPRPGEQQASDHTRRSAAGDGDVVSGLSHGLTKGGGPATGGAWQWNSAMRAFRTLW